MNEPEVTSLTAEAVPSPSVSFAPVATTLSGSAVAWMLLVNLLWGGSSVSAKNALQAFGPYTLTTLRFLPAGLILLTLSRRSAPFPSIPRRDWFSFFLLSVFGISLTYSIFYLGMNETTASDASLLLACEPLLIALTARLFLGEVLTRQQWLGMLVGLGGVYLIVGRALGNQIALLGLCCESAVSVVARRLATRYPGLFVVAVEMIIGALLLLPFALFEVSQKMPAPDVAATAGCLYLMLVSSAFGYGVWFRLLERYPVSLLGVFILIQPIIGPFFGWLLRGDVLKLTSVLGGALVLAGIAMTMGKRQGIGNRG